MHREDNLIWAVVPVNLPTSAAITVMLCHAASSRSRTWVVLRTPLFTPMVKYKGLPSSFSMKYLWCIMMWTLRFHLIIIIQHKIASRNYSCNPFKPGLRCARCWVQCTSLAESWRTELNRQSFSNFKQEDLLAETGHFFIDSNEDASVPFQEAGTCSSSAMISWYNEKNTHCLPTNYQLKHTWYAHWIGSVMWAPRTLKVLLLYPSYKHGSWYFFPWWGCVNDGEI